MSVANWVLIPLACELDPGDQQWYMVGAPYEACSDSLQAWSSFLVVSFVLGVPLGVLILLWLSRHQILDARSNIFRQGYVYGLVVSSYHSRCLYWEVLVLLRRVTFVSCFVVIPRLSEYRSGMVGFVLVLALLLQAACVPFYTHLENTLEVLTLAVLLLNHG
jgi:hypothetical protein